MRLKIYFLTITLLMVTACELGYKEDSSLSDAELIQMIIDADKIEIELNELPQRSIDYIQDDISYDEIGTRVASGLGYEVELTGNGYRSGNRNEFYFNIEGRKLDPNDWGDKRSSWDRDDKEDWQCFDLIFPITFEMPDGSTITVETDDEEGWNELKDWYDDNPGYEEVMPEFQYPVDIIYRTEDGDSSITINNEEEMVTAKDGCREEWDEYDEDCFEWVLPLTYIMPDGSTITVSSEEGYIELRNWYEENESEDEDQEPSLQYPVDIVYETEDGDITVTINNDGELESAYAECYEDEEGN